MLTNADGVLGPDDLGRHLLNPAFPLLRNVPSAPISRREVVVARDILDRYVGRYEFAPNVVLAITQKDVRLFAQLSGQPSVEIFASSPQQFFYKAVNAQLTFPPLRQQVQPVAEELRLLFGCGVGASDAAF